MRLKHLRVLFYQSKVYVFSTNNNDYFFAAIFQQITVLSQIFNVHLSECDAWKWNVYAVHYATSVKPYLKINGCHFVANVKTVYSLHCIPNINNNNRFWWIMNQINNVFWTDPRTPLIFKFL